MGSLAAPRVALAETLRSGQAFRWRESAGWFHGVLGRTAVKVRQEGDRIVYAVSNEAVGAPELARYFALDLDLERVLRSIDVDLQIHRAIAATPGLRVLRQDPWETLGSFILASFNNIRRIEGMIERVCRAYGDPVAMNGMPIYGFPPPERLARASERALRALGLGYRAPYLRATARLVANGRLPLPQLEAVGYEEARRALLGCDGVGQKVADCVALFGCGKTEAFPIDVWMARALRYYFRHRRISYGAAREYARRHFGPYAGYAQQYLYHYVRGRRSATWS
ncbi:MAG TPA: DNA glycosylase [bacterium]